MRVLIVEDDEGVAGALTEELRRHGHVVTSVGRGRDAMSRHRDADLVLLDLGLPDMSGFDVLRDIRKVSDVPVVILTARHDDRSQVRGLHLGADDYVAKPVHSRVLLARMDAVRRRASSNGQPEPDVVRVEDVEIDDRAKRAMVAGVDPGLTATEFAVLAAIARHRGGAVSRQQVMDEVWGDASMATSDSLDVHVARIRAKLNRPGLLVTIRGFGFRLGG